jgi:short-subunit dehydrogenase involved in D-alanine esterification of teichoic acids
VADGAVLITGATSGLGRWLAMELGTLGRTVLVHGRVAARVDETVAAVREVGGEAESYLADCPRSQSAPGLPAT